MMGAGTLGVISWADHTYSEAAAHTMGLVTFSLFTLFFLIAAKDERRTAFSLDTLSDKTFVKATGISVLTLIGATVLDPLQAFLDTSALTGQQWLVCTAPAASILVVSELWKAIRRRRTPAAPDTGRPGQPSTASQDELRLSTTGHRQRCTAVAGRPAARDGGKHPSTGPYDRTGPSRPARGSRSRRCPGRPGHLLRGGTACPS
jgi:hypothetical protein